MNKSEFVAAVAEKAGISKKDAEISVNAFVECVEDALEKGDRVQLLGFGAFEVRERKSRIGRNPRKPEEVMDIPESKAPVFKPGKLLKARVNK